MPQFHHKKTGKPAIMTGASKLLPSSVHVTTPEEIPDWEWNQLQDLAPEACFDSPRAVERNEPNKKSMFYFLSAFNGGGLGFWATRFESAFTQK